MKGWDFVPISFLGVGRYSLVFSAASTHSSDWKAIYALKRFSLHFPIALRHARNEHRILKKLTLEGNFSPFLPTLYYSFIIENSPVLVTDQVWDFTLFRLLCACGPLEINRAAFYVTEIICGLKHLHELGIVHMQLKLKNILLSKSGHVLLSGFDCSYDLFERRNAQEDGRFIIKDPYYMAPEIARRETINDKADIWCLGILMADLIGKSIYPRYLSKVLTELLAKNGAWKIERFSRLPKSLRNFFREVFTIPHISRPNITGVQELPFFKKVKWDRFQSLKTKPPFPTYMLDYISRHLRREVNPKDPALLKLLYAKHLPFVDDGKFRYQINKEGNPCIVISKRNIHKLGYSREELMEALKGFNFIHPYLAYRNLLSL